MRDYILARDMLDELDRRLDLRGQYAASTVDILSRLWPDATEEEFLEYYRDKVEVEVEAGTDITVLTVRAFDADMAKKVAGENHRAERTARKPDVGTDHRRYVALRTTGAYTGRIADPGGEPGDHALPATRATPSIRERKPLQC